ncbi:MAG: glycosyltransferase family 2 protein [Deltaproteobacteria bacterium]|nr:MAG: glycosyltransferase family 2 protein [Deltaproteobacteria bacterium]
MRPNGTDPRPDAEHGWNRVTSMARWLARRRHPAQAAPAVSVVIPVYNAAATLAECLTRLFQSTFFDFEVVLVDDGSTDQSAAIAANFPVRVVPTEGRVGPAAARNIGARAAQGALLFFIDSDVMVAPDTLARLAERYARGDVEGLIGVQAAAMRHRDLVSQYKNLWMRWTYARQTGDVPLFYTTAAAIQRDAFVRAGGFDEGYGNPNVEDTAFGQKLARLGIRIRVQPELEVEHVKRYSLAGLLRTDFLRAVALTRLKLRHRADLARNNTSVPGSYMASVPVAVAGTGALGAGVVLGLPALAVVALVALGAATVLNANFLGAIRTSEGWGRALAAAPLLWLELVVVGVGSGVGLLTYALGRRY